jgi:2-keto-4-pentenoate hydratase/2-oxohepta-3-ene-1,7-dioic acid hydratase in catechol pathway
MTREIKMRLASIRIQGNEKLAVCTGNSQILMEVINAALDVDWPVQMDTLLKKEQLGKLNTWYQTEGRKRIESLLQPDIPEMSYPYAPLFRSPSKIWGIGLNYAEHAADLSEISPTHLPASFMKPATSIIGYGDHIEIPTLSQKTTAEAELGVIIGHRCKNVLSKDWQDVVAGLTTIIDMTAEDILKQNPRYLTVSKSFDTFFSFGPQLVTMDEITDVNRLKVRTVINGRVHAENTVSNMTFPPDELVVFHSQVMTLLPGDVISTGTPGAVPISHGDEITCLISGFAPLTNRVIDLKNKVTTANAQPGY